MARVKRSVNGKKHSRAILKEARRGFTMIGAGAVLCHAPEATVALRGENPTSAAQFRRDVASLAVLLPPKAFLVNLCQDRYRFMIGFAAALMRGQVTLMPSANTPGMLADLAVLSEDYFGVPILRIAQIESLMTVLGGRIVYASGPFSDPEPKH